MPSSGYSNEQLVGDYAFANKYQGGNHFVYYKGNSDKGTLVKYWVDFDCDIHHQWVSGW
jgi:hypothetical protein